ncbi:hypothetical protein MMC14_008519 [Varicellaria rhodocarpa]|nr:hypothetical protein [Varicellaria rhodocarpa]
MAPAGLRAPVAPMAPARLTVPTITTTPAPPPPTTAPSPHEAPSITLDSLPQNIITHINELNDQNTMLKAQISALKKIETEAERLRSEVARLEREAKDLTRELTTSETRRRELTRALQQARDEEEDRKYPPSHLHISSCKRRYKIVKRKVLKRDSPAVNYGMTTTNRVRKTAQVTAASSRLRRTCRSAYRRE